MVDQEGDDGRVIRELDVYLCSGNLPEATKLMLLQYPLRPHWRPYNVQDTDKVKLKPKARKLQMHLGGQQGPGGAAPPRPLLLQSTGADMGASYAVGVVRDGRLLLASLEQVMQLRPSLAHLDRGAERAAGDGGAEAIAGEDRSGGAAEAMEEDDASAVQMEPVRVNVVRRETERQVEMRQRSYAWQLKEEEAEPWAELRRRGPGSREAAALWDSVMQPTGPELPMSLSRQQYLDLLVPGVSEDDFRDRNLEIAQPRLKVEGPQALGLPQPSLNGEASDPGGQQAVISAEAWAALPAALDALLHTKQAIVNLDAVRSWLRTDSSAGDATAVAHAPDADLHAAIVAVGGIVHIHGRFILAELGDPKHDPFRSLVLQLLAAKTQGLKRSDIMDFVKTAGLGFVPADAVYSRVMKELCFSRSAHWNLKSGEPWEV